MKGGGCKSRKHQRESSAAETGSNINIQQENRKTKVAVKRRRSKRLNRKRPREAHENRANTERQYCPLCEEELTEKNNQSLEGLIFCRICGRGFHQACSGIQEGWVGHWNIECRQHELECCPNILRSHTKGVTEKNSRKPAPNSEIPKKRIMQSIS